MSLYHVARLLSWLAVEKRCGRWASGGWRVKHGLPYCLASWATQHRVDCPGVRRDA